MAAERPVPARPDGVRFSVSAGLLPALSDGRRRRTTPQVPVGANATFNSAGLSHLDLGARRATTTPRAAAPRPADRRRLRRRAGATSTTPTTSSPCTSRPSTRRRDFTLDGDWRPNDRLDVKFALQHVDSSAQEVDHYAYLYAFLPPVGLTLSPYGSSALPKLDHSVHRQPDGRRPTTASWPRWITSWTMRGTRTPSTPTGPTSSTTRSFRDIRFGLKLTDRNEQDQQTPYNYQALSPYYNGGPYNYLTTESQYAKYGQLVNTGSWFNGQMGLPAQAYFPSNTMLNTNFGTLHQTLGSGVDTRPRARFSTCPAIAARSRRRPRPSI